MLSVQAIASVYSRTTPTKPLGMLTHFSLVGQPRLNPQVLAAASLTSIDWSPLCPALISWLAFSWLVSPADCPLLLPSAVCLLLSCLGPSFLCSLPVSREISCASHLCGFRAKTDGDSLTGTYTRPHNECSSTCHTFIFKYGIIRQKFKKHSIFFFRTLCVCVCVIILDFLPIWTKIKYKINVNADKMAMQKTKWRDLKSISNNFIKDQQYQYKLGAMIEYTCLWKSHATAIGLREREVWLQLAKHRFYLQFTNTYDKKKS